MSMIKHLFFILSVIITLTSGLKAQFCSYDPVLSGASILGELDPDQDGFIIVGYLENYSFPNTDDENNPVIVEICMENVAPIGGVSGISGTIYQKFTWTYSNVTNCFTGIQNQDILANESGTIEFDFYQVVQYDCPSQNMSITATIIPPVCAVNNDVNNDTITSYTCVRCLDFNADFISTSTACGLNNGVLTANASGGDGNYFYQWDNGSNSPSISNLGAGTHTVTITDDSNCSKVFYPIVHFNEEPVVEWSRNYGGSGTDIAYSMTSVSDGGFLAVGISGSNNIDVTGNNGLRDYLATKIDANGNLEWATPYGGSLIDVASDVKETMDGGFIITGRSASDDGDVSSNNGLNDVWVVKISNLGIIEWEKSYGGSLDDIGNSIFQTIDKGYIVGGGTRSSDGDVSINKGANDFWIIKLDQLGNIVWEKTFGGSQNEVLEDIKQTSDNGYIAVGNTDSGNGDVTGYNGGDDFWVVKLDVNGNLQWQTALGGSLDDLGYDIEQTADGGYITTGISNSVNGDVTVNQGGNDYCIFRLDASGGLLWNKTFGGSNNESSRDIEVLSDETYVAIGTSDSNDGDITENNGATDVWIVNFDDTGTIFWEESFGGSSSDTGLAIQLTLDGGFAFSGQTNSADGDLSANYGAADFWVAKLMAPPAISLSCNIIDQGTGNNDGVVEYTILDFTPPYTLQVLDPNNVSYSITNQTQSIDTLYNLIPGTYEFEVTDALGCMASCSFSICDLDVDFTVINTTCNLNNGSIIATISGGDGNYTVLWSNGNTLPIINNLPQNGYSITVTDGSGCSVIKSTFVSFSEAPSIVWEQTLGGSQFDYGFAFDRTKDGGYVLAGSTRSNDGDVSGNNGLLDFWIVKQNGAGNTVWQTAIGGSNAEIAYEIHELDGGGFIVAGLSGSNNGDVSQNQGAYDVWVTQLNNTGAIINEWSYGGSGEDVARAIKPTPDGGYIFAGYTSSFNGDVSGNKGQEDYWVVKLDNSGSIQWANNYGGTSVDLATALITTKDGGYFVTGSTESIDGDVTGNHGVQDIWAIKLDPSGGIQWQIALGGSNNDQAFDCVQTKDGGYLIQGQTFSSDGDVSINKGGLDYWLVKLDQSGGIQWEKTYGGTGTDNGYSLLISDADEIYISGGSSSTDGDVSTNLGQEDYWIAKLDNTGNIIWEKSFGGSGRDYCYQIDFAHDGGLMLFGHTLSDDIDVANNNGFEDYWMVKLDFSNLTVTFDSVNTVCFGETDGVIDVNATNGTPPYTYNWSNGLNTEIISGLSPGVYTVTVTDSENCIATRTTSITEAQELVSNFIGVTDAGCDGNSGQATIDVPNWNGFEIEFNWSNGYSSSISYVYSSTATGLAPGTYMVTMVDLDYNCSAVDSITIQTAPNFLISIDTIQEIDCNGNPTGILGGVVNTGGTPPYTYGWSTGATSQTISILSAGNYELTITDTNGCTATTQATLSQPSPLNGMISVQDSVSCFGGTDGSATVTVTGGTLPYSYSWSSGETTQTATNLPAGVNTVLIVDDNGCNTTVTGIIETPDDVSISFTSILAVSCNGGSDGSAQAIAMGGTPPYSYLWSNGNTTPTATGLVVGSTQVTVTDAKNCTSANIVNILQPSALSIMVTDSTSTSCTACIGAALATAAGGSPPYTFTWSNGTISQNATNLCAGVSRVTVTDNNGCEAITSVLIGSTSTLAVSNFQVDSTISCTGVCDAGATVTPTNGQPPYSYIWTDGQTTASASGLCAGTNQVTITDANGCTVVSGTSFIDPATINVLVNTQDDVLCFGDSTGLIEVIGTGGTQPYSFSWNTGETTALISNLGAGVYVVNIFDVNNCNTLLSVQITEPSTPVSVTLSGTLISCNGGTDGTATAAPVGGIPPYSYNWSTGATTITATGLSSSNYTITVSDSNNCTTTGSVLILQPQAITPSILSTTTANCGACVGTADLQVSGGTPPFTYLWSNGMTTEDATGLCAGPQGVTITDSNGCSASTTVLIGATANIVLDSITADNLVSCNGACDATSSVYVSGGQTPFNYLWSNGVNTASTSGLCAGTYQVTVTDFNGCIVTAGITFTDPIIFGASTTLIKDVSCYGGSDGSASTTGSGGTTPYSYLWSNGETTPTATNLSPGNQTVTLTDVNGCEAVQSILINQPDSLDLTLVTTIDASCSSCIGIAMITVSGGSPPYTFLWSNGATIEDATNLCSGVNSVLVTDGNGCTKSLNLTIGNSTSFGVVSLTVSNPISCNSVCDGATSLVLSGGQPPYTYQWSDGQTTPQATGLCTGTYTVTATDDNGCSSGGTILVSEPTNLGLTLSENGSIACGGNTNGSIAATVSGGSPNYSYNWSNGGNSPTITGLSANTYSLTVSDQNSCSTTASLTISEPALLSASAVEDTPASCSGISDGAASVTATGGIVPYTYLWTNGVTTSSATGLLSGTNSVTVTDGNGCKVIDILVITSLSGPAITGMTSLPTTCGSSDGQITVTTSGGAIPLTFSIDGGATTQGSNVFTNLSAQFYTVEVSDISGCVQTDTITVNDTPWNEFVTFDFGHPNCGQQNGYIDITVPSGNAPFLYSIDNGTTTQSSPIFNGLPANTYQIVVYDVNSCAIDTFVTLQTIDAPIFDSIVVSRPICGMDNGEIEIFASKGSTPYEYSVDNGVTYGSVNLFNNLAPGTYDILLRDADSCVISSVETLVDIQGPQLTFFQGITPSYCGQSIGQIIISANGGTPPLQYSIDAGGTLQLSDSFPNLAGGIYDLLVTDDNGCTATKQVTILDLDGPELDVASSVSPACGQSDGSVTLAVINNGVAPFEYKEINGTFTNNNVFSMLPQGTYDFVVKDSKNCYDTLQVVLTDIPGPTIDQILSDNPTCGNSSGSITIAVSGPSAPFQYSNDNGVTYQPSNVFANLAAGNYDIVVLDTRGCTSSSQVLLVENGIPSIDSLSVLDPACNNLNGEVTLYASGGNPPYLYSLDGVNFQLSNVFVNLPSGQQTFYVFDSTACQSDTTITLLNLTGPMLDSIDVDHPDCGMSNGLITLFGSGGNPPYSYSIDNGATFGTSNVFNNLVPSNYLIVIKDDRDCEVAGTALLQNQTGPQVDSITTTSSDCSTNTGSLTATISGGTPSYTYSWNTTPVQTTATATGLAPGQYFVTITDVNNCIVVGTGTVTPPVPTIVDLGPDVSYCGAQGTLLDPGPGLSYIWSTGATSQTISVNTVGQYAVTMTDFSNCISSDSLLVSEIPFTPSVSNDTVLVVGDVIQLQASGGMMYEWWPGFDLSCDICPDPMAMPEDTTIFYVEISATADCVDTLSVQVNVVETLDGTVVVPEVISPNGDGINDEFIIPNIGLFPYNRVLIVNRWGDVVYEANPYNNDWSGTHNGNPLPQGTYYYYIELDVNKVDTRQGSLTLLR